MCGNVETTLFIQGVSWINCPSLIHTDLLLIRFSTFSTFPAFFLIFCTVCDTMYVWFHIGAKQELGYKNPRLWWLAGKGCGFNPLAWLIVLFCFWLGGIKGIYIDPEAVQSPFTITIQPRIQEAGSGWYKMVLYWSSLMDNVARSSPLGRCEPACCICIQYINNGYFQQYLCWSVWNMASTRSSLTHTHTQTYTDTDTHHPHSSRGSHPHIHTVNLQHTKDVLFCIRRHSPASR